MPNRTIWFTSFATVCCGIFLIVAIVDPIWTAMKLHVPGDASTLVNFTQPVDSVFYVRNAEYGYKWGSSNPTSIWFHPLVVWLINLLPSGVSSNIRLWIISIASGVISLYLIASTLAYVSEADINPWLVIFALAIPGGLGIATGNAEFTCLIFTSLLFISVVNKTHWLFPLLYGGVAVLAKPNALYMVPVLTVYLIHGFHRKDKKLATNSLIGICSVLSIFFVWALFVDFRSQEFGAFWIARKIATVPLSSGIFSFIERSIRTFLFVQDEGEKLKFATALFIPAVDIWLALIIPYKREVDRIATIAGISAIILSTLILNNPNKVVIYVTTIPAHFMVSLLFIQEAFRKLENQFEKIVRRAAGLIYFAYCFAIMIFFILGTPLGWYY